jgi:hypothetical protein
MSEFFEPFRVKLLDVNKKRMIADEYEEDKDAKRTKRF